MEKKTCREVFHQQFQGRLLFVNGWLDFQGIEKDENVSPDVFQNLCYIPLNLGWFLGIRTILLIFFRNPGITTWDEKNLVNDGVIHLSTGAGFLPSTVAYYNPYIRMGSIIPYMGVS